MSLANQMQVLAQLFYTYRNGNLCISFLNVKAKKPLDAVSFVNIEDLRKKLEKQNILLEEYVFPILSARLTASLATLQNCSAMEIFNETEYVNVFKGNGLSVAVRMHQKVPKKGVLLVK